MTARRLLLALLLIGTAANADAQQAGSRFLAREDILLYGLGLRAEPAVQTVPRDIATIVSTLLQAPTDPGTGLPPFAPDAVVRATLRGPSFATPLELSARPNTPFNIPPLTIAGPHTLENIRLISGGEVVLHSSPESVRIDVIDRLLVTQVTARALSAAEIRERGLVFDKSSFQAYNFAAAFAVDSGPPIQISFPVVLPTLQGAGDVGAAAVDLATINPPLLRDLSTIIPDTLKLQTRIPNLSVVGFALKAPSIAGQNFFVPPIPGVVVIPGDIGFLDQVFSVLLMVANVAPGGSGLVVNDLQARIVLPPGRDTVVGSGDDPLIMGRTAAGETPRLQLVSQTGADGQLGTADDILTLGPGETGNAEFLVEGRREGSHVVEMELSGTLSGLPIGPVPITGRAMGAVLVRNPTFTLTFTHPEIVNAGESYSLDVTITNTSNSPANFVSLNLYERNVSGATIVGDSTRQVESIPAGDSATVTFDLVSRITGRVTAATLDSDENVAGRFGLKTSVGELGVPLSPDSLVLPKESSSLPKSLRDAALGLLGKAYAVATAPAAALPRDVKRFSKKIVWDRAVEVAEAGFRFTLHEPLPDTAAQLLMDFAGSGYARLGEKNPLPADLAFAQDDVTGFDEIRRRSVRGGVFAQAVAGILSEDAVTLGTGAFHQHLATQWSYRAPHFSALVGGQAAVDLVLIAPTGERLGPSGATRAIERGIPFSDHLTFGPDGSPTGSLALVATAVPGEYVIRIEPRPGAPLDAPFDLSVVVPNADGTLRQIRFDGLRVTDGPVVAWNGSEAVRFRVEMAGGPSAPPRSPTTDSGIVDPAPSILGVMQFAAGDALVCRGEPIGHPGRVVSVLFSEEVTAESVQDRLASADLTRFRVDGNAVVGVALQPGRRIAFLALRDPVGPFIARQLTASDVTDRRGQAMVAQTLPIEITVTDNAGVVSGQVLQADGTPVAFANVRLLYSYACGDAIVTVGISAKSTDEQGRYSWDFVLKNVTTKIIAVDPESDAFREIRFNVARHAQRLNVNIVFMGRGAVTGRVFREDGRTPIAGAAVRVTSLTDQSQYGATSNADGSFTIGGVPVGNILIEVVSISASAQVVLSEHIPFAGAVVTRDISLLDVDMTGPEVSHGRLTGHVIHEDGTAVGDVPVVAYYRNHSQVGVRCPPIGPVEPMECAIAVVRTDATGAFAFENLPSGSHRIYAVDQAALQEGQARIVLQPDGAVELNLILAGGLGTVRGRVVDPAGVGVADASVGGGLSLTTTNANGEFVLTDVPVGRRSIVAASDALGSTGSAAIDLIRPGDEVNVTIVLPSTASVSGTILAADGVTPVAGIKVYLFKDNCDVGICVTGQAISNAQGGYRIDKAPLGDYSLSAFSSDFSDGNIRTVTLSYFQQVFRADVRFRGGNGRVTGIVFDDDGVTPLQAAVSLSGDQLVIAGGMVGARFEYVQNFKITETNFTTGRFSFGAGVWVGPFTIRAAGQFSPDPVALESNMPAAGATVDLTLRLQSTSQIAGVVYQPDGVTPVGADVIVRYKSDAVIVICSEGGDGETTCTEIPQGIQEETVVTNAAGEYWLPVVNAGAFTLVAEDPVTGKVAHVSGAVRSGERAELSMRLVGRGQITIEVRGSDSVTPIPGARIEIQQLDFPNKILTGYLADNQGVLQLTGGDAFSEGQFVVTAVDVRNGFAGRASGRITQDGETVLVRVFLYNATGTVSGHVFRADGTTPVPNAEVVISNDAGPLAFAVTDSNGAYEQDTIPLGSFQVDVFEAATAARAFGTGRIDLDHQVVPVDVTLAALGVVRGFVVEAGTETPLKGWLVSLRQVSPSGRPLPERVTTTGVDGGFSFPGTSVGPFQMSTSRSGFNGVAAVTGNVARPGAVVEVPIVVAVIRPAFGRIQGTVFDAGGSPAANSQVQFNFGAAVTAGADGRFVFESVPLGRFLLTARSQTNNNIGTQRGELNFDGATVDVPITLVGLSQVAGSVRHADGSVAAGVQVTLTGSPATGCAGPCVVFTDGGGTFTFTQVAARSFSVTARDTVSGLSGSVGDTLNPGETRQVSIVLAPSRQISGRVLSASGRPAAGIVLELVRGAEHLFIETAADGTFVYPSVVIGAYSLAVSDPIGPGIAQRNVNVTDDVALGDIVLDENDPTVVEMTPQNFSVAVPRTTPLVIRFSEPVAAGTVSSSSIVLRDQTGPLGAVVTLGSGDAVATITPIAPLRDQTPYSITVTGIQDRLGKPMRVPFSGSFITEDVTAPSLIEAAPAAGADGVPIYTTVRLKYSEGLDTEGFVGAPVQVRGPTGVLVPGRLDFLFGNTVVVFTPNVPLAENTAYTATIASAVDLAGNRQAAGVSLTFSTTDRTPPSVLTLGGADSVIENDIASFVAGVGSADVAVVDFFVNDVFVAAARSVPFTLRLQAAPTFGTPGQQIRIHAVATDTSGNRGPASTTKTVAVTADQPPVVTIAPPAGGLLVGNGERVTVQVTSIDDLGSTQIAFRPTTGVPGDAANRTIQPAATSRTETFAFNVPMAAVPGSTIQIQASAVDTKGQTTPAVPVVLTVTDATPPVTSISGVSTGDRVRPGQHATAVVVASDLGGIASVGFTVSGAATLTETRLISPAQNSVGVAFSFDVSAAARPTDSVFLDAFAVDAAGNRTNAARVILPVADATPPTVRIRPANGRLEMVPGRAVDVIVDASDELAISRLELIGSGAFTLSTARQVSPPLPSAATTFAIDVPATLANGAELTLQARAVDLSGNVSTPVSIVLSARGVTEVTLPASVIVIAGETADVSVTLSTPAPAGGLLVELVSDNSNVATPTPSILFAEGESSRSATIAGVSGGTVALHALVQNVQRASMTVTVRGGIVRGTVLSPQLAPVVGAQVTVTGAGPTLTAVTDSDGHYFVEGASGAVTVTVRALDPLTQLLGYATGQMNRLNGFVNINVVLISAGALDGQVVDPTGTPVGANVQVRLFNAGAPSTAISTTFTDAAGQWFFPLVAIGNYLIDAADAQGNRGVSSASITASGQEVTVPLTYLGRGVVHGTVRNAAGTGVANASVTLASQSLFGQAPNVTRNAESDGTFRFEGVFVGTFTVSATDPVSSQGGATPGTISAHAQTVEANIALAPTANLQGRIFRSDGATPVAGGVSVLVQYCTFNAQCYFSTTTDSEGRYAFAFLPLGTFTLSVSEPSTRGRGSVQSSLSVNGETRTLNVSLLPQGNLVVTVRNADDVAIAGASVVVVEGSNTFDAISGTTDLNGQAVIERVLAGNFTVTASAGGLTGQVTGVLAPDTVLPVAVRLEATATIRGTLFAPDGQTPATGGRITLNGRVTPYPSYSAEVGTDGSYSAAGIRLNTYDLRATDANGRLRAILNGVGLTSNGQIETRDLVEVGLGTVRGRVIDPDSSSASGIAVTIQSLNATFGGFFSATTEAAGIYQVTGVAVGDVVVRAGDSARSLLGEARGVLTLHGGELVLDVLLQNNATSPVGNRYDGNGSLFQTQQDGSVLNSTNSVFSGAGGSQQGGFKLQLIPVGGTATSFTGASIGTLEDGGQELAVRQPVVGTTGLDVTRKIYVPQDGYFARYLEILTNPTASDITVDVRVLSHLRAFSGASLLRATSDGDTQFNLGADHWVTFDDNTDGDPIWVSTGTPVAFVFDAPGATAPVNTLSYPNNITLTYQWRVTVPANGQAALMHFGVQQTSRAAAAESATRLVQLPPEALAGLSPSELAAIKNFVVPADGLSAVAPLPRVDGRITGRVLEADGVTVVPNAQVRFVSNNLLYQRRLNVNANASGVFTVAASLPNRQPVAIDAFSLVATYPSPSVQSPSAAGSFGSGATTAAQDIVFSNLARVTGVLRRHDGTAVTGATVSLSGPGYNSQRNVASDGSFSFGGLGAGTFTFTAEKSHPQGTGVRNQAASLTVVAGQSASVIVLLQPTGVVEGTLRTGAGALVANRAVELFLSGFYRSTVTDTSGRFASTEMPAGTYTLRSYDPVASIYATRPFVVTQDQTTTADLSFLGLATVNVTVRRASGAPGANVNVNLQSYNNPLFSLNRNGVSNATGGVSFANVPVGPYRVVAYPGINSAGMLATSDPFTVDADNTVVPVTVTMAPYGSARVRLRYGNGTIASDRLVELISTGFSWSNYTAYVTGEVVFDGIPLDTAFTARIQRWEDYSVVGTVSDLRVTSDGQELVTDLAVPALASVSLTVLDSNGQPFVGRIYTRDAIRPLYRDRGQTNGNGQILLSYVPQGEFSVAVHDPNTGIRLHTATSQVAPADEGTTIAMTLNVVILRGNVEGRVLAADGITPLPGSSVYLYDGGGAYLGSSGVDANGFYRFSNVLTGNTGFVVNAYPPSGIVTGQRTGSFSVSGETVTLDFILPLVPATVSGHVYLSDGATAVVGASVELYTRNGSDYNWVDQRQTDALGAFAFPTGFLTTAGGMLRVWLPNNRPPQETEFSVPAQGGDITVNVVVPARIGTVSGVVTAGDGTTPLPGSYVQAFYDIVVPPNCECDSRIFVGQMNADSQGRFAFANIMVPDSGFVVSANSPANTANVQRDVVFPGQQAVVDNVVLAVPVALLLGNVTYQNGDAVPNPSVFATVTATGATRFAQTNTQGQYTLEGLPDGPFTLTAQDSGSGLTTTVSGTFSASSIQRLDVVLPPSVPVRIRATASNGTPLPSVTVAMVAGGFQRQIVTDVNGEALFAQVAEGPVYVQARWNDGTTNQFASTNVEVVAAGGAMTVTLQFGVGGTVSGVARDITGAPLVGLAYSIRVLSFGSIGPLGSFDRSVSTNTSTGQYTLDNVPPGLVQVILAGSAGIANGVVVAGTTSTVDVSVATATSIPRTLTGTDGFRYDVQSDGNLNNGGSNAGLSDAYDGMYRLSTNGVSFPAVSVVEHEVLDREIVLGPRPNGQLLVTRKVFVPAPGGFARYLEIVTNTSATATDVNVLINGNLGSDSGTVQYVSPVATNNTYAVTFDNRSGSSDPALAHVFAGTGAVAAAATVSISNDNVSYSWRASVPAGGTVIFMHFAVQREPTDTLAAETQAVALVNLTDPNALAGLSAAERAAIRNFVVP